MTSDLYLDVSDFKEPDSNKLLHLVWCINSQGTDVKPMGRRRSSPIRHRPMKFQDRANLKFQKYLHFKHGLSLKDRSEGTFLQMNPPHLLILGRFRIIPFLRTWMLGWERLRMVVPSPRRNW